jgi:hypothetical protein
MSNVNFAANFSNIAAAVAAALLGSFEHLTEAQQQRVGKIADRIAADAALISKVTAQKAEANDGLQDQVQVGRRVAFIFGRADTAVELQGTVFARKEAVPGQKGSYPQVKIEVGEGFDTELKTVHPNSVIRFLDEISPETVAEIDADIGSYGA